MIAFPRISTPLRRHRTPFQEKQQFANDSAAEDQYTNDENQALQVRESRKSMLDDRLG
jgi:hypothetical protein